MRRFWKWLFASIATITATIIGVVLGTNSTTVDITLKAQDQNSVNITAAEIYIDSTDTWYAPGTVLTFDIGEEITVKSRLKDPSVNALDLIESEEYTTTIESSTTEIIGKFYTLPVIAKDQNGNDITGAEYWVNTGLYQYHSLGIDIDNLVLPYGNTDFLYYLRIRSEYSNTIYGKAGIDYTELNFPFWTATVEAKDQNNNDVLDAFVELYKVDGSPFPINTEISLPENLFIRIRGITGNISNSLSNTNWAGQNTFDPGFVTVTFKAYKNDGITELTTAEIDIINRNISPIFSGDSVAFPYPSSIRIIVSNSGGVVADKYISITSSTYNIDIVTSAF